MNNQPSPRYIVTGGPKEFITPHLEEAMRKFNNLQRKVGHYKVTMILTLAEVDVCTTVGSPEHIKLLEQLLEQKGEK